MRQSDYSAALWPTIEAAYKRVKQAPAEATSNGNMAMVLHGGGKYQVGEIFYRRAIALDASFRWFYYLSQLQTLNGAAREASQTLEQALKLEPRYVPARIRAAKLLIELGRLGEAQALLEATAAFESNSPIVEFELGRALQASGRPTEAIQHWERASKLQPEYGTAQYALAMAYRVEGRTVEAKDRLALYERYKDRLPLQKDPLEAEFLAFVQPGRKGGDGLELARRALKRGDLTEAARQFEAELANDAGNVMVHSSLIAVYYRLGDFERAKANYLAAMKVNPNYADAHFHYGMSLLAQGNGSEAKSKFEMAIQSQATHAGALTQIGLLSEKSGDDAVAMNYYRNALENEPDQRQGMFLLGRQLVRLKKYAEGIGYLEKAAVMEDEQTPRFLRALAGAHHEAGHSSKAIEAAEKARVSAAAHNDQRMLPLLDEDIATYRRREKRR